MTFVVLTKLWCIFEAEQGSIASNTIQKYEMQDIFNKQRFDRMYTNKTETNLDWKICWTLCPPCIYTGQITRIL